MMKSYQYVDISILSKHLSYDAVTGVFTRVISSGPSKSGTVVGSKNKEGYLTVCVQRKNYLAHRVAFAMHHGSWPSRNIDHINQVRTDNRIFNLREALPGENSCNQKLKITNTSGYKGVVKSKRKSMPWSAQIMVDGKCIFLGNFKTAEEAAKAYDEASFSYHGEFASPNSRIRNRK